MRRTPAIEPPGSEHGPTWSDVVRRVAPPGWSCRSPFGPGPASRVFAGPSGPGASSSCDSAIRRDRWDRSSPARKDPQGAATSGLPPQCRAQGRPQVDLHRRRSDTGLCTESVDGSRVVHRPDSPPAYRGIRVEAPRSKRPRGLAVRLDPVPRPPAAGCSLSAGATSCPWGRWSGCGLRGGGHGHEDGWPAVPPTRAMIAANIEHRGTRGGPADGRLGDPGPAP